MKTNKIRSSGKFIKITPDDVKGDFKFEVTDPGLPICPVCGYVVQPGDEACVNLDKHETKPSGELSGEAEKRFDEKFEEVINQLKQLK